MSDKTITDDLLWLDLETTGSDVEHDGIIEVGAVLTTCELDPMGEFSMVVQPSDEALGRLLRNDVVKNMHESNGLLGEVLNAKHVVRPHHAARALLAFLEDHEAKQGQVALAGSGVGHFDRKFLDRHMPQVSNYLRYWCLDIGVVRRAHQLFTGQPSPSTANDQKPHRALDDARLHLEEARAFKNLWAGL